MTQRSVLPEAELRLVDCDEHGPQVWRGHLVCAGCREVYARGQAPRVCACGAVLAPSLAPGDFAARPCCPACFLAYRREAREARQASAEAPPSRPHARPKRRGGLW